MVTIHALVFRAGISSLCAAYVSAMAAGAPAPETHRLSARLHFDGKGWVAPVVLPLDATRFALAVKVAEASAVRPLRVKLLDANGHPLESTSTTVAAGEYEPVANAGGLHFSPRFSVPSDGHSITVRVSGGSRDKPPLDLVSVEVDVVYAVKPQGLVDDGSVEMCGPAPNKELARSVARLAIRLETGTYAYCTGFAIGPNHLLTNNHCIEQLKEPACSGIQIEFNYTCAAAELSSVVQPQCVRVIRRNSPTLDYAVIEFKAPVGTVPPLKPARAVPGVGKTFLLHHSAGMAMRRGMSNRAIARLDVSQAEKDRISEARADCSSSVYPVDKYFTEPTATERERVITHAVNTTAGASGAPVFVGDQVVGLHFDRDKRYYPLPEKCFDAGVENCMVRKLGLPNWAVPVCDVLDDIAGSVPGLQRCAK